MMIAVNPKNKPSIDIHQQDQSLAPNEPGSTRDPSYCDHHHHHSRHIHSHGGDPSGSSDRGLWIAFFLNFGFCLFEAVGGYYSSSQAILADAFHDFGDSASILLVLALRFFSKRPPSQTFSYGYQRVNLVGSTVLAVTLILGALALIGKGFETVVDPRPVNSTWMIILSLLGVAVNGMAFIRLNQGHGSHGGPNEKLLSLHFIEDLWGWVFVLVGASIIFYTQWFWIDPALSIFLGVFILVRTWQQLGPLGRLFLLGSSGRFSEASVVKMIQSISGVASFHHLHVWELESGFSIISVHLVLKQNGLPIAVKRDLRAALQDLGDFEITIEIENENEVCLDPLHLNPKKSQ